MGEGMVTTQDITTYVTKYKILQGTRKFVQERANEAAADGWVDRGPAQFAGEHRGPNGQSEKAYTMTMTRVVPVEEEG